MWQRANVNLEVSSCCPAVSSCNSLHATSMLGHLCSLHDFDITGCTARHHDLQLLPGEWSLLMPLNSTKTRCNRISIEPKSACHASDVSRLYAFLVCEACRTADSQSKVAGHAVLRHASGHSVTIKKSGHARQARHYCKYAQSV